MKKLFPLVCVLLFAHAVSAQQKTSLYLGMSGEFGYMSLQEAYHWRGFIEDFRSGTFSQIGFGLEFRMSDRWSLQSGVQLARYQYLEKNFDDFPEDNPHIGIHILPKLPFIDDQKRTFTSLGIPLLLQYHLEDLVPGRLHLAISGGIIANIKRENDHAEEDFFYSTINKLSFDWQIGPTLYWDTKFGLVTLGPVFRMALTNYALNNHLEGADEIPKLLPYSLGMQFGYFWKL
ncbi:MAG: hypothetical protein DHS20C18_30420 [Saprospiraceae bacterium]|nr:MAG: hypothetical protein DHS20C18_30420 [Saprospiraceae bacterium]